MFLQLITKYSRVIALLGICGVIAILSPNFLTVSNLINVLRQAAFTAIIATGMTLTMLIAGIDLSVGSILALTTCLAADFLRPDLPITSMFLGILIALGVGAFFGCLNGLAIVFLRLPDFLVTFGMMQVARGLAFLYMHGTVVNGFRDEFTFWGAGRIMGVPVPIIVAAAVILLTFLILKYTNFGRDIYGIGAKRSVAIYSGISVPRTTILVYSFSGFIVSLAGLLYIARLDAAEAVIGEQFVLQAIAAAAIGGVSFDGGVGSVLGTVVGALILTVLANGMNLLNISSLWQVAVTGAAIVIAVILDRWLSSKA
jgi:ribose/xylose/arabinose/galactoside ABC-type transport system permease subunit